MTRDVPPVERLQQIVTREGTQKAAAKKLGISQAYLCDLLNLRRDFSDQMLEKLGLKRIVVPK